MFSGVVPREAESLPICEAVRYQQMGESVLLREERCLCFKVDICEISVAYCGGYLNCGFIATYSNPNWS